MKKRQVLVIHGGDFFDSREEYFESLKKEKLSFDELVKGREKGWKENLQEDLGSRYAAIFPKMPLPDHARYEEWKLWFEKLFPFLEDGIALVGHSLGAIFLERYLSENDFPKRIGGLFLLASPYWDDKSPAGFYTVFPEKLVKQAEHVFLYHSEDDDLVAFDSAKKYMEVMPNAKLRTFKDRGHLYAQTHFPELVEDIRSLK